MDVIESAEVVVETPEVVAPPTHFSELDLLKLKFAMSQTHVAQNNVELQKRNLADAEKALPLVVEEYKKLRNDLWAKYSMSPMCDVHALDGRIVTRNPDGSVVPR